MDDRDGFPLAAFSCFSLARGVLTPEALVEWAAGQGCAWVGMADSFNFYGLVRFIKAARARGIKPVPGMRFAAGYEPGVIAWPLDGEGFQHLNRLASLCLDRFGPHPAADGAGPGALAGAARGGGALPAPAQGIVEFALDWLAEQGWPGLALALAPGPDLQRLVDAAASRAGSGDVGWPLDGLMVAAYHGRPFLEARRTARSRGIRAIALNPGIWRDARERRVAGLLRAIERRRPLSRLEPGDLPPDWSHLASPAEMRSWFVDCPEMLAMARDLAARVKSEEFVSTATVFPSWNGLPEAEAARELERRCREGMLRRYGQVDLDAVNQRLGYELGIIQRKGFSSYFLVVHDIVSQAPRTCGRGSAAASIVSYLLGITHVEPLGHKLFFERFLNDDRRDPPDIDVDFPWDERSRVLAWVFEHFPGRSAMVADHVTFGARSALRESALALGYPQDEVDRFSHLWLIGEGSGIPEEVRQAARSITSLPRYLGLHPGGVVVTPRDMHRYSHTQTSLAGWPVLAWEKDATEDAGLVKIDLLGNRSLAVLRDSLAMINPQRQEPVDWGSALCLSESRTRALVDSGQTLGVFYVESPATRQLLRKMGFADYEHLVVASSIIRPAANRFIAEYVRRLHGGEWRPLHPLVADVLADTLGIMVYQEDVSRVAIAVAGFSAGEADGLRKVLTRKDRESRLADSWKRFRDGAAAHGVEAAVIQALWDMILSFDGYSFCKSHSASYALVSYQLAWVRAWYPLEFFTAVINNGGGFYSRQVYLNEVRRLGFPVRGPDVNDSQVGATIRNAGLRLGLSQIASLSVAFLEALVAERDRGGQFRDLDDFVGRMAPGQAELRLLIRSGALDSLAGPLTRPQIFWVYAGVRNAGLPRGSRTARQWQASPRPFPARSGRDSRSGARSGETGPVPEAAVALRPRGVSQGGLFPGSIAIPESIGDYRPETKLSDEMETLGLLYSRHPLDVFASRVARLRSRLPLEPLIDSRGLASRVGQRISIAGTLVTEKEVRTKKADAMSFVSFEDPWGIFETVLFPEAFARFAVLLVDAYAFIVRGRVQSDNGAITIEVDDLVVLNRNQH